MSGYKFIITSDADGKAASAGSAAKSHAIRAGIRNGWMSPGAIGAERSRDTVRCKKELNGRYRLPRDKGTRRDHPNGRDKTGLRQSGRPGRMLAISTTLSETVFDPFDSLPIPQNRQVEELISYFLSRFNLNASSKGPKMLWFPYAMQSVPAMCSTLALTAAYCTAKAPLLEGSNSDLQQEGLRQKGEAMRLIGKWLSQVDVVPQDAQSAFFVTSISTLACVEVLQGNFEAADTHLVGVRNLLHSLGGHERFRDEILCKSINIADILLAAGLGRVPLFPLLHSGAVDLPDEIYKQASEPPLDHLISLGGGSNDLVQIFSYLRQATYAKGSDVVTPESLRILMNLADHCILRHLYGSSCQDTSTSSQRLAIAITLAAHLFMYVILREVPTNSLLVRTMGSRLHKAVQEMVDDEDIWQGHFDALQWIACVGLLGAGTEASDMRDKGQYFVALFESCTVRSRNGLRIEVRDPAELERCLSKFLWDGKRCNRMLQVVVGSGVPVRLDLIENYLFR